MAVSSSATRCTIHDASVAVTMPSRLIPPNISTTATPRPVAVTGVKSPYPTVVIVVIDHHNASPKLVMWAPGVVRSASRAASEAMHISRIALVAV